MTKTSQYKFWLVLSLIVAFAAGIFGGIFSERYYFHRKRRVNLARNQTERSSAHFPSIEQLAQDLNLSAEQQEQIRKIFERNDAKLKDLRSDMRGRLSAIRAELKTEVDAVLTAEQKQKFEAMIESYLEQRKRESDKRRESQRKEGPPDKPRGDIK
jgi:cell division protein ZapA (FtsZ GTPase activity inhibitor)